MSIFSFSYIVFVAVIFMAYWTVCKKSVKVQNVLLLVASWLFYGLVSWKSLILLLITSLVTVFSSKLLKNSKLAIGGGVSV